MNKNKHKKKIEGNIKAKTQKNKKREAQKRKKKSDFVRSNLKLKLKWGTVFCV